MPSGAVTRPADEAQLGEILAQANSDGTACRIAGGSTKMEWGNPSLFDLLLSTAGLHGCTDVDADNLTLSAAAGTTVAEARAQADAVNRILPLDPGHPGRATIGGVAATGDQGARAAGYGGLRDVVLGIRATLADGSAVKFGGRTMKNVTGYDMTKLFVGSFGVLGVITEVTFRLLPRYDTQALVVLPLSSLEEAKASVARVLTSYLQPLALEVVSADALPPDFASSTAKLPGGRGATAPGHGRRAGRRGPAPAAGRVRRAPGRGRPVDTRGDRSPPRSGPPDPCGTRMPRRSTSIWPTLGGGGGWRQRWHVARLGLRASVPISRTLDVVLLAQDCAHANGLTVGYRAGAARGRVDLLFAAARGDGSADRTPARRGPARRPSPPASRRYAPRRSAWAVRSSSPAEPACCRPATTPGETWARHWLS